MSWWEVLLAIPVLSLIGACAGAAMYRAEVQRHGRIEAGRDEFNEVARALGVDPAEVWSMGLMCAAFGMRHADTECMVRRWASDRP
ncbi:hypothetical protein M2388_000368 [Leucobacter aridicollis]|nr:hypothetical protein [Leucobacter aridicollis]